MDRENTDGARKAVTAKRVEELVARAAKRADWARSALQAAAGDLAGIEDASGGLLTSLVEQVHDEAERVGRLAEDIRSRRHDAPA
ncbi:MAG: hypothetical protein JWM66_627 [Solirubrobacterales bacterium]|jgi:hypothetical protein|nr:hypothetical protein [Solirubrobacterales bacterium]